MQASIAMNKRESHFHGLKIFLKKLNNLPIAFTTTLKTSAVNVFVWIAMWLIELGITLNLLSIFFLGKYTFLGFWEWISIYFASLHGSAKERLFWTPAFVWE